MGQITIEMDHFTVREASQQGASLVVMKAVVAEVMRPAPNAGGGFPLVWLATKSFDTSNVIAWDAQYQAFSSPGPIAPGGTLPAGGAAAPLGVGQLATIQSDFSFDVEDAGLGDEVIIMNEFGSECVGGFGQSVFGNQNPLCAFSISQAGGVLIRPVEMVFLAMTLSPITLGMVLATNPGSAMMVDLTENPSPTVWFDRGPKWDWGGASWGSAVPANSPLASLLVRPFR